MKATEQYILSYESVNLNFRVVQNLCVKARLSAKLYKKMNFFIFLQIKLIFTLAGLAYSLHTIKNFREISNKLSKNSFNSPVIRPNKCLAKQD